MDASTKIKIAQLSCKPLWSKLVRVAVTLADIEKDYRSGSGTLVRIADHLFVATAAHVIPPRPNGRMLVIGSKWREPASGMLAILRHGKEPACDVGYLDLDVEIALEHIKCESCGLEDLRDLGQGRVLRSAILLGSPSCEATLERQSLEFGVVGYSCSPMSAEEIEERAPDNGWDSRVDVFLDYQFTDCRRMDTMENVVAPTPPGMSGGGLWDQGFDSGVWSSEKAKLFAIQNSWHRTKGYIRATQIRHWLRLICDDYPDLREVVAEAHPSVVGKS